LFLANITTANTLGAQKNQGLSLKADLNHTQQPGKPWHGAANMVCLPWEKLPGYFSLFFLFQ
jgi:hypothetical protein